MIHEFVVFLNKKFFFFTNMNISIFKTCGGNDYQQMLLLRYELYFILSVSDKQYVLHCRKLLGPYNRTNCRWWLLVGLYISQLIVTYVACCRLQFGFNITIEVKWDVCHYQQNASIKNNLKSLYYDFCVMLKSL